ncbi:LPD38 domain-containing protein, partial [Photobacterium sp. OFAV2-7]|uniref:LPD38 domain-containing protein n=1 Tax=Photobacterium sp. OFAV2-7 TaxID=2917748 RepID=UPI00272C6E91
GKAALGEKPVSKEDDGSWKLSNDPAVWSMHLANVVGAAVPTIATVAGTGGGQLLPSITQLAIRTGASPQLAAKVAPMVVKTLASSPAAAVGVGSDLGSQGVEAKQNILDRPFAELAESQVFKDEFRAIDTNPEYDGLTDTEKLTLARENVGNMASRAMMTDPKVLATSVAATMIGDIPLANVLLKGGKGSIAKGFASGAVREAPMEALQEGTQQYAQNEVSNEFVGTDIDPWDNVAESAATGGALGAAMGGSMGAAGNVRQTASNAEVEQEASPVDVSATESVGPTLEPDTAEQSPITEIPQPELQGDPVDVSASANTGPIEPGLDNIPQEAETIEASQPAPESLQEPIQEPFDEVSEPMMLAPSDEGVSVYEASSESSHEIGPEPVPESAVDTTPIPDESISTAFGITSNIEQPIAVDSLPEAANQDVHEQSATGPVLVVDNQAKKDEVFSKTGRTEGRAATKGMPKPQADLAVKSWLRQYNGGARVSVKVVQSQAEAEQILGFKDDGTIHAFYLNNEVVVVADNLPSTRELRSKLRHEVLVHHGLAAVVGDVEYDNILMKVYSGKNSKYLRDVWEQIELSYRDKPIGMQVEEVLAAIAEVERGKLGQWYDRVVAAVAKALRKVGLMSNGDVTQAEMRNIVETLADRVKAANAWAPNTPEADVNAGEGKLSRAKFSRVPDDVAVVQGKPIETDNIKDMRLQARATGFEIAGRAYQNNDSGHLIQVGRSGIKHTISGANKDLLSSVASLPELLTKASYLGSEPEKKGNPSVKAHHYYGVKFNIEGRVKDVIIGVREMADGKYYYDHSFERNQASGDNGSGPRLRAQGPIAPRGGAEATTRIANSETKSKKDEPKFSRTEHTQNNTAYAKALHKAQAAIKNQTNPETDITDGGFAVPAETMASVAVRKIADKFKVLKDVQSNIAKAGGKVDESNDAYLAEELFHGKAENDLRLMRDTYVKPLADKMAKFNISQDELDDFLRSRHAEERNKHIASINPEMPDGGSGMKTADAHEALETISKSGKQKQYEELAHIVYGMLKKQRDVLRGNGLESEGTIDAWENSYQYYVPLKGIAKDEPSAPRTGKGFSNGGKESKRAMGRKSQSESPTSHAIIDLTEKLIRARKNEVGNALLKLVQDNPSDDYWQVFTQDKPDTAPQVVERKNPETGELEETVQDMPVPMAMMSDFYFPTKKDGKTYYIRLHDERLMKAMKNVGPDTSNGVIRTMAMVNRFLASMNTSYNPEFVLGNFSRDIQTAILNLSAEQTRKDGKIKGEKIAKQVIRDTWKAGKAIHASLRNKKLTGDDVKWQQYYEEFMADGAKTGWFDMKDIDAQAAELERMTEMVNGTAKGKLYKGWDLVTGAVENANSAIENAVRLSAYVNARKANVSRKKAASLAKNMTVNFNRRGEIGTTLNAMYMFANASIQGSANFMRTMYGLNGDGKFKWKNLNKAQKIAVGAMAGSFALASMNRAGAGEDDDGVNWYDKVPGYVKERNFVLMKSLLGGEQDGSYWKIPMPYGYNVFSVIGTASEAAATGTVSPIQGAGDVMLAALGSFSPIGVQESNTATGFLLKNALPSIFKPFVEVGLNENFMGGTIYNENMPFGTPKPNSMLGRRSTNQEYKDF